MASTLSQAKTLEEIHLLKCSLLPGELLEFTEQAALWNGLLDAYALDPDLPLPTIDIPREPAHFQVKLEASTDVWFEVAYGADADPESGKVLQVSVKGDNLGRAEQARWQAAVAEAEAASTDSEYPLYEMVSAHLLPQLHAYLDEQAGTVAEAEAEANIDAAHPDSEVRGSASATTSARYHALFVSHHLKSPQKRRSLSQWSHELSLVGFAKVGYPGVIYCEGAREDVEDFVGRVRSMQWLALRLRFVEPAPSSPEAQRGPRGQWSEFEKVGEVVEEMRRLGREQFVVEMGIGSAGSAPTDK